MAQSWPDARSFLRSSTRDPNFRQRERNARRRDELSDLKFWLEVALLTDIMTHMNELNTNLQGKEKLASDLYSEVKCFVEKLRHFVRHMGSGNLAHFPRARLMTRGRKIPVPRNRFLSFGTNVVYMILALRFCLHRLGGLQSSPPPLRG